MSEKDNRQYYLSRGRCPRCGGANPLAPGRHSCLECALKQSEQRHNRLVWRRENGLCTRCGRPLPDGYKYRMCDYCRAYAKPYRKFNKERYENLKAQGLCVKCGEPAEPGKTLCRKCLDVWHESADKEIYRERKRQKRKELREKGLCIDCYTRKVEPGHTRCKRCREMRMDSTRKYRIHKRLSANGEA